jgi:hypothetical protein
MSPEFCYYGKQFGILLITLNMLIFNNLFFNFLCGSRIEPDWQVNGLTHLKEVEQGEPGVCEINFADKIPLCLPASWYGVCPFLFTGIFGILLFRFPCKIQCMTILIFVIIITLLACHTPHTLTTAL